jgi:hypothetical protein
MVDWQKRYWAGVKVEGGGGTGVAPFEVMAEGGGGECECVLEAISASEWTRGRFAGGGLSSSMSSGGSLGVVYVDVPFTEPRKLDEAASCMPGVVAGVLTSPSVTSPMETSDRPVWGTTASSCWAVWCKIRTDRRRKQRQSRTFNHRNVLHIDRRVVHAVEGRLDVVGIIVDGMVAIELGCGQLCIQR